jgi:hypothetical protein
VSQRASSLVLYLLGHGQECLFDVGSALCRGFQEWNAQLVRKFLQLASDHALISNPDTDKATNLCNGIFYDLLGCQIGFITDKELVDPLRGISVNLLQPLLNIGECVY